MHRFRNKRLRQVLMTLCLTSGLFAWQNSVAEFMFAAPVSGSDPVHQYLSADDTAQQHVSVHDVAFHHCPNCAAHFLALGMNRLHTEFRPQSFYGPEKPLLFKHSIEEPPTPPPDI